MSSAESAAPKRWRQNGPPPLNWASMMPRDTSLSDSCVPNRVEIPVISPHETITKKK